MASLVLISRLCSRHSSVPFRYSNCFVRSNKSFDRSFLSTSAAAFSDASLKEPLVSATATVASSTKPVSDISSASSSSASTTAELDLTQFLSTSPTETVASVAEKVGPLVASDLDLTWYLPTGAVFNIIEYLNAHFPTWGSIAIFTLCARIVVLPRLISNQKFSAEASYWMPDVLRAQQKLSKAISSGNQAEIAKVMAETPDVQEKQMSLLKNSFLTAAVQMPIFISVFQVLRAYSTHSIVSFKDGGLYWFTDLTVSDPYYILQTYMALSLYFIFKSGVEFGNATNAYANPIMNKFMFYGVPAITFATTVYMDMPAALLLYWCFNNTISVVQVNLLRQKAIKKYLNIPDRRKFDLKQVRPEKSFKETWSEMREGLTVARDFNAREVTARAFERAGVDPPKKTRRIDLSKIQPPK